MHGADSGGLYHITVGIGAFVVLKTVQGRQYSYVPYLRLGVTGAVQPKSQGSFHVLKALICLLPY
jgi:hypothetical protein